MLGQIVFTLNGQNFIDGAGFNYTVGSIGNLTPANGVAVDVSSTPYRDVHCGNADADCPAPLERDRDRPIRADRKGNDQRSDFDHQR
jgi:hypothetical protein